MRSKCILNKNNKNTYPDLITQTQKKKKKVIKNHFLVFVSKVLVFEFLFLRSFHCLLYPTFPTFFPIILALTIYINIYI